LESKLLFTYPAATTLRECRHCRNTGVECGHRKYPDIRCLAGLSGSVGLKAQFLFAEISLIGIRRWVLPLFGSLILGSISPTAAMSARNAQADDALRTDQGLQHAPSIPGQRVASRQTPNAMSNESAYDNGKTKASPEKGVQKVRPSKKKG
jgi:hypothetical protein